MLVFINFLIFWVILLINVVIVELFVYVMCGVINKFGKCLVVWISGLLIVGGFFINIFNVVFVIWWDFNVCNNVFLFIIGLWL